MESNMNTQPSLSKNRNWVELPPDITVTILHKLGAIDILENAQKVCTYWRKIFQDPAMWRVIDMHNLGDEYCEMDFDLEKMTMHAIDRSCGQLLDINIEHFGTENLLHYIADRSGQLRRLQLVWCNGSNALSEVVKKLPLLEELHLYYTYISKEAIETLGRCCPLLKLFKLNAQGYRRPHIESDEEALAIAQNLPHLRHLQLFGNKMTNDGLQSILDGCPHLESLDLRQCFNLNLGGDLAKRCSQQIKHLRRPHDSTEDYGYDAEIHDCESFDEDYPSGISDVDLVSGDEEFYELSDYEYDDIGFYDDFTAYDDVMMFD